MTSWGTRRDQAVGIAVAMGVAGLLLLGVLLLLGGAAAYAGFHPDAGFTDSPSSPAPPGVAEAATWDEFTPTGWVTQSLVSASVSVTDTDGLQEVTAQYSYSTDGGGSWFSWGQTGLTVSGDLTTTKRMTVTNLFLPDSATNNFLMFRILDGAAMTETSPSYPIRVDSTPPSSSVGTSGWFKTLSVITGTASDATSGVARVDILIRRADTLQYYTGSGWGSTPVWLLTAGTTNWSYAFAPTETVTYTVSARATDIAGLVQPSPASGDIYFDNTPPTSTVGTSGYYRTATWTGAITGTASDVGSGVQKVEITLRRVNDGLYYDGSGGWVGSAVWLLASGGEAWSYTFAPSPGMTYEVRSQATDNAGNVQPSPSAAATFMLDIGLPTSAVGTNGYYGAVTWTGNITGTAGDTESGVDRVDITIRRPDGYYYNGSWWQATPIWLLASGTANWHYPFTPEHGQTYTIQSRAQDLAGNQQIAYGTGTLIYDSGVPSSSVTTSGLLGKTAWAGAIAGLASDDFAGVDTVHITIARPDGQYYTGAGWSASPTWLLASGTTAWTYAFTPTQGITYTVQSKATDRAGNVQTAFGLASFSYDGTDPIATVGVSGYYGPLTWSGAITGTATDGESGVQSVVLSIKDSLNRFWNGSTWQPTEVWLPASGTTNWSYAFAPQNGETYTVRAKATDRAGNEQMTPSQSTFTYDAAAPVSAIATSGFYRLETWTGAITGTASDEGSGLQRVELTIQRPDNAYYNGAGWQPTEFWLTATGTDAWQREFTPTDGMTYTIRSRAVDAAGNVQAVYATSSFCYDLQPPDSQVGTSGYYNALTWTGAITGTATDATSGVLGVAIVLQRSVAPHYWNGSIWQAAQTWVTATGSVTWSHSLPAWAVESGVVYTVTSRAVDKAGNTEIAYGTAWFALDLQEPDSIVGTSGFYRAATWTGAITGTASAGISGVARVEITVQRSTDDQYYNGTGWQLAPQWLTATGTLNWSYPFSPTESVTYTVQSRAWSVSGNPELTYGVGQFIYDSMPPTATLGTSAAYRTATWTGAITGTATDTGVGVDFVDFTLQRSTDSRYFSGSAWVTSPVWLRATGADTWARTFSPPEEAIYTVRIRPVDKAGNAPESPAVGTFILDNTAPYAPTEPDYYDGWKNTNVFTVTWTNAPDLSGIAGAYYKFSPPTSPTDAVRFVSTTNTITDISVPAEGVWDFHLWLQDNAGNVNHNRRLVWPSMFKYDATPPQTTHSLSGPAGDNGWFRGTVTATLTVTDQPGLSGVGQRFYQVDGSTWMTTTASFLVSGEGVHTFRYYSTDLAGNVEPTHTYTVGIDATSPSVSHTLSGTLSATGWYTSPVTVILEGTDATSGVDDDGYRYRMGTIGPWLSGKTFVVGGEGTRTFYYYAIDRAGNQSEVMSGTVRVDTVPPLSSIQISGAVGDNGWYRSSVGVTISVTDTTSGPAPDEVYYRLDGGPWVKGNTVAISSDGDHVLEYYGVDVAGNVGAPVASPVRIDTTPPGMPMDLTPSPSVWTNVNRFSISWTPPADTSGIAGAYYKLDAEPTFNTDGTFVPNGTRIDDIAVSDDGRHSITVWLRDMAGNTNFLNRAARINAFLYDSLPPTTNASLSGIVGNNGWFTSPVTITFVSQDQPGLSGVSGVAYSVNASAWVTQTGAATAATVISTPGKHVVEYRGMDAAGNVESVRSVTVRVDNQPPAAPTDVRVTPSGWSRGSTFTVTWKNPVPADDSGIAAMYYKLNAPPTGPTDGTRVVIVAPSVAINVTTNGEHDLYIWLEDLAGNVGYQNYAWLPKAIRRDALPPTVTHALAGTLGAENWYVSPVTVTLTATDTLSGLAAVRYRVNGGSWQTGTSVVVNTDGEHTVAYRAEDIAGNQSGIVTVSFRIDRTPPIMAFIPLGSFQITPSFMVSWTGLDPTPGSGLARYDIQVADGLTGAWVDWLTNTDLTSAPYVGQRGHTYGFRARARDVAGNQGTYPPSAQILVQVSPVVNGDLETGNFSGWTLGCTPTFNRSVVRAPDYRGVEGWVARLGDPAYTRMDTLPSVPVGAACMSQTFAVPPADQMLTPILSFWYHIYTYDVAVGSDGRLYDTFDVTITRQGGSPQLVLRDGNFTEPITSVLILRDLGWRYAQIDLSPYAGQTITVQFANWNREYDYDVNLGLGWYNTWTLVDLVQVRTRLSPKAYLPAAMVNFDGTRTVRTSGGWEPEAEVYPTSVAVDGLPRR